LSDMVSSVDASKFIPLAATNTEPKLTKLLTFTQELKAPVHHSKGEYSPGHSFW